MSVALLAEAVEEACPEDYHHKICQGACGGTVVLTLKSKKGRPRLWCEVCYPHRVRFRREARQQEASRIRAELFQPGESAKGTSAGPRPNDGWWEYDNDVTELWKLLWALVSKLGHTIVTFEMDLGMGRALIRTKDNHAISISLTASR